MEDRIRVFLADSSRDYLELLRSVLEQEDDITIVGTATRGDQAVAALPSSGADVLVTDLLLPGLDGLNLLRRLRTEGCLPHAIVVSAFYNDRIARTVSHLADNFLPKPCPARELVIHIRETARSNGRSFVHSYDSVVSQALLDFSVPTHLDGFHYLRDSLLRVLEDHSLLRGVTKALYRDVGKCFDTTAQCVEHSIRTAIKRAWALQSPEERRRKFGHAFDSFSAPPTNVPFLTVMVEFIENRYEKDQRRR